MSDRKSRLAGKLAELNREPQVPGTAIGLLHADHEMRLGVGVTNSEHPLPVDERTLFQIASLTKPFTTTALLRLSDQGRLELERPLAAYLPRLQLSVPAWTGRVRVVDLLTHVGGWLGDHFLITPPSQPALEGIESAFAHVAQLTPPGAVWSYNNAGFTLAGRLLEQLTGKPFAHALRELVLEPLGLAHTFLRADEVVTHRLAAPHIVGRDGPHVLRGGGWQPGWEMSPWDQPVGGLVSCVDDLLTWARFQLGDGRSAAGEPVLRPETLERMHGWTHDAGGDPDGVGLAWLLYDWDGVRFSGHTGQTAGYLSEIVIQRERRFACVVLTNAVDDGGLRRALRQFVLREWLDVDAAPPKPRPDPPRDLSAFTGSYDHPFAQLEVRPAERAGELILEARPHPPDPRRWQPPTPPPQRLAFTSADRLVVLEPARMAGVQATFVRDADGHVAWLRHGGRIAPRTG